MSRDPECVFCKIVAGAIPARIVLEDDRAVAFLDAHPLADGHVLIVPKDHFVWLPDVPAETVGGMARLFPILGRAALAATGADGFNILLNNGTLAGQFVDHVHFHLIPRRPDDGLGYRWCSGEYAEGQAERIHARYVQALTA